MATLHIEHAITDFGTWKGAFDRFSDLRRENGMLRHRVHSPVDDPCYLFIELDFATGDEAARFRDFLVTRVWSTPGSAPALLGSPQTRILELRDQADV